MTDYLIHEAREQASRALAQVTVATSIHSLAQKPPFGRDTPVSATDNIL